MDNKNEEKNGGQVSFISKGELFIEKNKNIIIISVAVVVVAVLAIFGIRKFVSEPRQAKANDALFAAEQWFAQGDFETALNGDDQNAGLLSVIDKYGSTKAGKRAKYEAGLCCMQLGRYSEALSYLKKYKGKDQLTPVFAEMGKGDAECEMGNLSAAVKHYTHAAEMDANYVTSPSAWFKAGMANLMNGDSKKAAECFKKVKNDYPESSFNSEIDRYIKYAEEL